MLSLALNLSSLAVMGGAAVPPWKAVQNILARGGYTALGQFDATNAASIALSGASVTGWTDLITGITLAPGVSSTRPIYSDADFGTGPCVIADGIDDYLSASSVPYPVNADPCEIWTCADQTALGSDGAGSRRIFSYGSSSGSGVISRMLYRSVVSVVNRVSAIVGDGTSGAITETSTDFSGKKTTRLVITGTNALLSVNGGTPVSAPKVPTTTNQRTVMFANLNVATAFWKGSASCVLITPLLDDATADKLLAHFNSRISS